jgi:glucose-1-phosphatase
MPDPHIKNLIFDLGGVILDLSVPTTLDSFSTLSGLDRREVELLFQQSPEFNLYEKGQISDAEFRDFVRNIYRTNATDEQLDASWNAMLLGIPVNKLELLSRLKDAYNVFLLSNTNGIHLRYIDEVMLPALHLHDSLNPFFHKVYYSHLMKMRKPDAEIFQQVLKENNLIAEETLFLDDNASNVKGAEAVGIKTVHVLSPSLILDYFHD